jgi:hypothetical protein
LANYLIPVHADMPEFDIAMIDEDDPHLPGSVNGIGMLGTAGIQAAIANAVFQQSGSECGACRSGLTTGCGTQAEFAVHEKPEMIRGFADTPTDQ